MKTKPGTKEYGHPDRRTAQREKPSRIARRRSLSASDRRGFTRKEATRYGHESS